MPFVTKIEKGLLHPAIGGATAVLTVMAGAMASFWQKDIETNLVLWPLINASAISVKASLFWLSVFGVGGLLGGAQWATRRQSDRAQAEAKAQVQSLRETVNRVESLPPEDFLGRYQTLMRNAARSTVVGFDAPGDRTILDPAIRNILAAILELARSYDSAVPGSTYAANIMLYRPDRPIEAAKPVEVIENAVGNLEFDGVLELVRSLSTSSHLTDNGPDQAVAELIIPIPRKTDPTRSKNLSELHPVLPGAAWAFVYKEFAGFATIDKLDEWLELRSSAASDRKESVRSYFRIGGAGARISSFASRPLLEPGTESEMDKPLGVLNLHSDRPGLLAVRGGDRFSPLLEPFCMMLSILLVLRRAAPPPVGGEKR